ADGLAAPGEDLDDLARDWRADDRAIESGLRQGESTGQRLHLGGELGTYQASLRRLEVRLAHQQLDLAIAFEVLESCPIALKLLIALTQLQSHRVVLALGNRLVTQHLRGALKIEPALFLFGFRTPHLRLLGFDLPGHDLLGLADLELGRGN